MSLKRHFLSLQSFGCHWSLNSVGELCRTMSKGVAIGSIAILLAACDDDSGSFTGPENESEITETSSSSKVKSSSSEKKISSSSVGKIKSSSSATLESSSSSSQTVVLSSESHEESSGSSFNGWSWDVPKEARLNPEITYGSMTDSRDGKTYKTVKIGNQTWMAENLNYADSAKTPSLKGKSWCFGNDTLKCGVTGRLYTWAAAIDSVKLATDADNPQDCGFGKSCTLPAKVQGVCPPDWHLPTYAEWNALFTAVGGQSTAATALKSQSGWYNNGNGTDAFGFSALPAGIRGLNGSFYYEGYVAYFWSSSENYSNYAYFMDLYYGSEDANLFNNFKNYGFSVRCLKD